MCLKRIKQSKIGFLKTNEIEILIPTVIEKQWKNKSSFITFWRINDTIYIFSALQRIDETIWIFIALQRINEKISVLIPFQSINETI